MAGPGQAAVAGDDSCVQSITPADEPTSTLDPELRRTQGAGRLSEEHCFASDERRQFRSSKTNTMRATANAVAAAIKSMDRSPWPTLPHAGGRNYAVCLSDVKFKEH